MTFDELVDEYIGDADAISDIRVVVRRLYFYDFVGVPLRIWQGQGKLFTEDGNEWLGSIDSNGNDHHKSSGFQDGRDGSSATYKFGLQIPDIPGQSAFELFEEIKADQWKASGRNLTIYMAVFKEGEALRPTTPIKFLKELTMIQPQFSESIDQGAGRVLTRRYTINVTAKDGNAGRSNRPNGTYADTIQKRRAAELGVSVDKGSEYLASLANRTFVIP